MTEYLAKYPEGIQMSLSTDPIEWFRYPFVAADDLAKAWLTTETLLGLAPII
jgi:hypothetical protein